jgi:hypothetical protein
VVDQVVALHGAQNALPVLVSAEKPEDKNTLRAAIIPFACWRVDDVRFAFDSSIVGPDVGPEMDQLGKLIDQNKKEDKKPLASIFGHADPTGSDDYNKVLSGRRAQAIYALLTRKTDLWEKLYSTPKGGDSWADKGAVALMLKKLGYGTTTQEKKRFQSEHGLSPDGDIGKLSRAELFKSYMNALSPVTIDPKDFLGQGADPDGKADYQGCSEFNPQRVFSKDESQSFSDPAKKAARDDENAPNRRVMVFLFRPGTQIDPKRWPCPRASEGVDGCKARFWSDGDKRRNPQDARREFKNTKDTFGCRFYHRLSDSSPCEGVIPVIRLRLYGADGAFLKNARYRLTVGDDVRTGSASDTGNVAERFQDVPTTATVEWGPPEGGGFAFSTTIFLQLDANDDTDALAKQRLSNLGYTLAPTLEQNVRAFQNDFKGEFNLASSGKLDDPTRDAIRTVHTRCADNLRQSGTQAGSAGGS